jgi:hypothetical protein
MGVVVKFLPSDKGGPPRIGAGYSNYFPQTNFSKLDGG